MGFKQISGIEWTCDNCGTNAMTSGDISVGGAKIPPVGWFSGRVSTVDTEGSDLVTVEVVADKFSCLGQGVRKLLDATKVNVQAPKDRTIE
jgi:hypothetical protein